MPTRANSQADLLQKLGLHSPQDLVLHLPLRYEDLTALTPLDQLRAGQVAHVVAQVLSSKVQFKPKRQLLAQLQLCDGTPLQIRLLHFYPNQQKQLADGAWVRLYGELRAAFPAQAGLLEMVHPTITAIKMDSAANADEVEKNIAASLPQALTPIYPTTAGLGQGRLRKAILSALQAQPLPDTLPEQVRTGLQLMPLQAALQTLHLPPAHSDVASLEERTHPAWVRIKFDELLAQQLSLQAARETRAALIAPACVSARDQVGHQAVQSATSLLVQRLRDGLPFQLTQAQQRVSAEIAADLAHTMPMARLLQGDVGSGKTVVAALAAAQALDAGYQCALMVPTEILAEQHWHKLHGWFTPLGVRMAWLAGALSKAEKKQVHAELAAGVIQLVIGTHALIQEQVQFANLGLAIIDEQHRFGVAQRVQLQQARHHLGDGRTVHQLMMSATPIPRTLAMTYFADLDVSTIDELPPGRQAIKTKLVEQARRAEVLESIRQAVAEGRQAYWVCPLIEEGKAESEALQLQTALDTYALLSQALSEIQVGLLHGRMKADEKASVMAAFVRGEVQLLVATTVIEVGVDVPNASLMVIEHAERFGLAQLHQLRGRVGRGSAASVCVLLYAKPLGLVAKERLRCLYETQDGFVIAQRDLELRGPGEFLGVRQAGVPMLRYSDLDLDSQLVDLARTVATTMRKNYPEAVKIHLDRWLPQRATLLRA